MGHRETVSSAFPHCCTPWKRQSAVQEHQAAPVPRGCVPAHLDLDAEDGPVLGEAEGLQPRQVGKAHRVTAQRVHVLVTATLCDSRGQTTPTGRLALGRLLALEQSGSPGGAWEQAGKDKAQVYQLQPIAHLHKAALPIINAWFQFPQNCPKSCC